jgi:hypothetical protein
MVDRLSAVKRANSTFLKHILTNQFKLEKAIIDVLYGKIFARFYAITYYSLKPRSNENASQRKLTGKKMARK